MTTPVRIPIPWRGMDLSAEPETLETGKGTLLRNVLPGRNGLLVPRGPLLSAGAIPLNTDKDDSFSGAGGFWVSPDNNGASYLQQAGTGATVSKNGGAPFALPAGIGYIAGGHVRMGTYTVGCTNQGNLMTWDGGSTVVRLTNGPANVDSCATHLTRVFALTADGTLRWTDPVPNLPANTAALWQDDVSGLTNQIPLPTGGWYRDLVVFNRVLYIISTKSVYALVGDTPAAFSLRKVLDIGAGQGYGHSMAGHCTTTSRGFYFHSTDGITRFDGVTSTTVSQAVHPFIAGASWVQLQGMQSEYLSAICDGTQPAWLLYHEPTNSWSTLTSTLFPASTLYSGGGMPSFVRRTGDGWSAYSAGRNSSATRGYVASVALIPEDQIGLASLSADPLSWKDNFTNTIDAQAVSASIRLSPVDRGAALRRLHAQAGSGDWTVQVEDEAGVAIGNVATITGGASRGRAESELFSEHDIVRVRWTWNGWRGSRTASPSVGDAFVLADVAQQR